MLEELSVQDEGQPPPSGRGRRFQQRSASHPEGLPGQEAWSIPEDRWIRILFGNAVAHLSVFLPWGG